jgi:hypothetical protein
MHGHTQQIACQQCVLLLLLLLLVTKLRKAQLLVQAVQKPTLSPTSSSTKAA